MTVFDLWNIVNPGSPIERPSAVSHFEVEGTLDEVLSAKFFMEVQGYELSEERLTQCPFTGLYFLQGLRREKAKFLALPGVSELVKLK
jgi:hypothetical protein